MSILSDIKTTGFADVMVILRSGRGRVAATTTSMPAEIKRHLLGPDVGKDAEILKLLKSRNRAPTTALGSATTSAANWGLNEVSGKPVRFYPHLGIALGAVDRVRLAALRREPIVDKVVAAPDLRLIRPVAAAPAEAPRQSYTWGLKRLGVDVLREKHGLTGKGVLIGHLDTGIDGAHPALRDAVQEFAFFDAVGNYQPGARAVDSGDHGTHTAGTIVGRTVDGVCFGVAPDAKLASATVIEGGRVIARILAGMDWALSRNVRILNMSLGLVGTADTFLVVTRILRKKGVLPVFAIGNEGPGTSRYPGNYVEALSVGAIDGNDNVADFSGSQRFIRERDPVVPDLVAPGVDIVSCEPGGGYQAMNGTSMATPHISGLAALLMEAAPNATADQIEQAIFTSCKRGAMSATRASRGCPDGVAALKALLKMTGAAASKTFTAPMARKRSGP